MKSKILLLYLALSMPFGAVCAAEEEDSTQAQRELAWIGEWRPAASQGFRITKDFELSFSDEFPLTYLRGSHFELHLQEGEEGFIGAEGIVEQRRLMFLIFADDKDRDLAWLVINRIDKVKGQRTEKNLLRTFFHRVPAEVDPSPDGN